MASIVRTTYKSKKGRKGKIYFSISYRDIYGNQHLVGGYKSETEAKRHLHEFENSYGSEDTVTVKELFDLFKKKAKKYARNTRYNYEVYYNRYFKSIENNRYKKLTIPMLQDFFDDIEEISPYSAIYCLKMFKAAINNAIRKQVIKENKLMYIDPIRLPVPDRNRHLNLKEAQLLLSYAKETLRKTDYVFIFTMLCTGMRFGETCALNKSDINFEDLTLEVTKQYTKGELKNILKTDSSCRTVHFFDDLAEVLSDYMKDVEGDILFPNKEGTYINNSNFRGRIWLPLLTHLGFQKKTRLQDLRGSYVDIMLSMGVSPKFIQNNIGHSTIEMTMGVYAKNNAEMVEFARQKANGIFHHVIKML